MTHVTISKDNGHYRGFSVDGHACFNTSGPDILCSAISMASQMTANGLEAVAKVNVSSTDGDGFLVVAIEGETNRESDTLIESFELAVSILHKQYSDFITMSHVEGAKLS